MISRENGRETILWGLMGIAAMGLGWIVGPAQAQNKKSNGVGKIYCWQENGMTKCGNIPQQTHHVEIKTHTGIAKSVGENNTIAIPSTSLPLSSGEGATPLSSQPSPTENQEDRVLHSLIVNYPNEQDLLKRFQEETHEIERQAAHLRKEQKNQRNILVKLLLQLSDDELRNRPIPPKTHASVMGMHQTVQLLEKNEKHLLARLEQTKNNHRALLAKYRLARTTPLAR